MAALAAEARALGPVVRRSRATSTLVDGTLLAVSGVGAAAAARGARALVEAGATALASFGTAGGLDPRLCAGTLLLPVTVVAADGRGFPTAPAWRHRVRMALAPQQPLSDALLLTSVDAIATVQGKAAAFRTTGAAAVDMESAAVAEIAAECRLPFLAVRAIVDTAEDVLPHAVLAASRSGRVQLGRLVRGLASRPSDFLALLRLAQRYQAARRTLRVVGRSGALAALA